MALTVDTHDPEEQEDEDSDLATVDEGSRNTKGQARRPGKQPQTPESQDEEPDEETDGDEILNRLSDSIITRKRKSVLRPAGGKSSKKAAGRRQSFRSGKEENDSSELSHSVESPTPGKGFSTRADQDDAPDVTTSPPAATTALDSALAVLPVRRTAVKITQHSLPSYEPQGPGDTWTCQFDECKYKVYNATKPESRAIIKSHFRTHAEQAQEKLDLIYQESRPYLPVK